MTRTGYRVPAANPQNASECLDLVLTPERLSDSARLVGKPALGQGIGLIIGHASALPLLAHPVAIFDTAESKPGQSPHGLFAYVTGTVRNATVQSGELLRIDPPLRSVFVVYARLFAADEGPQTFVDPRSEQGFQAAGTIMRWGWVCGAEGAPTLPAAHERRFAMRLK